MGSGEENQTRLRMTALLENDTDFNADLHLGLVLEHRIYTLPPNGFPYPTTIAMTLFRSGYIVCYLGIRAACRAGNAHVRLYREAVKFLLIKIGVCTLYSAQR